MVERDDIKNLREVFRELVHLTIDWEFNRNSYDGLIRSFRRGDMMAFNVRVQLMPNDILWANKLDGHPLTPEIYQKILALKKKFD